VTALPLIKTENLRFVYGTGTPYEIEALGDINISIEPGELLGVIGHTGSGKSTLIQHLNGLIKPTSGQIFFEGVDIWRDPKKIRDLRFKVGLVFQYPEYQLFEETVHKDIAFGPKNMGLDEAEIHDRVVGAAALVGLHKNLLDKSPFELSGGEKRRAAIAGVIAMQPQVLILDEPTAGLDPLGRDRILAMIKDYRQSTGSTVVLVSHSMEDIARMADRILVLSRGRVGLCDEADIIFSQAEELTAMGLDIPSVTGVFRALRQQGFPVRENIYTVAQAKAEVLRVMEEKST